MVKLLYEITMRANQVNNKSKRKKKMGRTFFSFHLS